MITADLIQDRVLTLADVIELTRTEGDAWKLSHVRRVLKLIELIGKGMNYDQTAVTRRDLIQNRFTLPLARQMSAVRLARLEQCLDWLPEESFAFV